MIYGLKNCTCKKASIKQSFPLCLTLASFLNSMDHNLHKVDKDSLLRHMGIHHNTEGAVSIMHYRLNLLQNHQEAVHRKEMGTVFADMG